MPAESTKSPSSTQLSPSPSLSSGQIKVEQAADTDDQIQSLVKFVRGLQGVTLSTDTPSQNTTKPSTPEITWKPTGSWEPPRPPASINVIAGPSSIPAATPAPVVTPPKPVTPANAMPPPPPPRSTKPAKEDNDKPIPILMPPRISHGFFPPGPPPPPRPSPNLQLPKRSYSPPPVEAKPQSYPPAPTYTNPLGIRPSGNQLFNRPSLQQNQPVEHKPIPKPQQNGNKKRLSVGNEWPNNRQSGGNMGKAGRNDNLQPSWIEPPRLPPFGGDEEYDPKDPFQGYHEYPRQAPIGPDDPFPYSSHPPRKR